MANKVTGTTDTSDALNVASVSQKSVLIVSQAATGTTTEINTVFSIGGTADAISKFGADAKAVKAVKTLIQNKVDSIYGIVVDSVISEDNTLASNYADALEVSLGEKSVKCIVLDMTNDTIISELKTHLAMAESEDMFRYAVIAVESDENDEIVEFASDIGDSRIFVVGPTFMESGAKVDAMVVSAGVTGAIMTETSDPALPMNGVVIYGIGNVNRTILESDKNLLTRAGVTVLYNDSGSPVIHRLVTSYTKDEIWQEGTTRFIADYILENVENTLRARYKRTKNVARILDSIKTTVKGLLENYEALEIIENFDPDTLTVVRDPQDRYGALVDYEFDVVTPLYTITIKQHLVL